MQWWRGSLLLVLGLVLGVGAPPLLAKRGSRDAPEENTSHLKADSPWIMEIVERASRAQAAGDWTTFVRAWQEIVDLRMDDEDPGAAAPHVLAVRGSAVFEGAWRVAHHRILEAGEAALEAYRKEYGDAAVDLLRRARAASGTTLLETLVDRFLPLAEGRTAALLLADRALESGDPDGALAWLERLEDVEEVTAEPAATIGTWRRARIVRMALALAAPSHAEAARAFLEQAASDPLDFPTLPPTLRRTPRPLTTWPMAGGRADRSGLAPAVNGKLEAVWPALFAPDDEVHPPARTDGLPSAWLPPRAVTDGQDIFVNDGRRIWVFDAASGKLRALPFRLVEGFYLVERRTALREREGLLEGHGITLGPRVDGGRLLYVTDADPEGGGGSAWSYDWPRADRLRALLWTGRILEPVWTTGGAEERPDLPSGMRIYGSPLLYRGRLWVSAIRPTRGSSDQADAWLLGLDPLTGRVAIRTWLGAGPPVRNGRPDEAIPSSPAGAAGRVVVSTSIGIVVAVNARHGRTAWALRHDRGAISGGRLRRLAGLRDGTARQSGFENQAPILGLDRVFVAPTDGPRILFLCDRPRGAHRALVLWRIHRRFDLPLFAAEQLVGLATSSDDPRARLVLAGKGASPEGELPPPLVVTLDALHPLEGELWRGVSPTGHGAETYGRALLTPAEVLVPTPHGLVVYDLRSGRILQTVDESVVPKAWYPMLGRGIVPYGNLIPVPGLGIAALNENVLVLWRRATR